MSLFSTFGLVFFVTWVNPSLCFCPYFLVTHLSLIHCALKCMICLAQCRARGTPHSTDILPNATYKTKRIVGTQEVTSNYFYLPQVKQTKFPKIKSMQDSEPVTKIQGVCPPSRL